MKPPLCVGFVCRAGERVRTKFLLYSALSRTSCDMMRELDPSGSEGQRGSEGQPPQGRASGVLVDKVRLDRACAREAHGMAQAWRLGTHSWDPSSHMEVVGSSVRRRKGTSPGCTPAICLQMPVNDWIERKCKQDSRIVLENHQAGKGEKPERSTVQTLSLMQCSHGCS